MQQYLHPPPDSIRQFVTVAGHLVEVFVAKPWGNEHLQALAAQPSDSQQAANWRFYAYGVDEKELNDLRASLRWDRQGRVSLNEQPQDQHIYFDPQAGFLRIYDSAQRSACWLRSKHSLLPDWEAHMPFREFWHVHALYQGELLAHCAVIVDKKGRGALLIGASGVGKSTLTLQAITQDAQTVGDDYVRLKLKNGKLFASLQFLTLKQKTSGKPDVLAVSGATLPKWLSQRDSLQTKVIYTLAQSDRTWAPEPVEICVIIAPSHLADQLPEGKPCLESHPLHKRLTVAELLKLFAPNQIFQCPVLAPQSFALTREITQAVPGYWLDTRCGPHQAVKHILELLRL